MSDHSSSTSRPASPVNSLPDITSPQARPYRFNWDTTSYRNGPASVSGTSNYEGNADYITSRNQQNIFSMSTFSLSSGALPKGWSSSVNGFHAISNVLNNPKRPSDPPKAHQPVPPIPSISLPPVKKKDFEPYMKAINGEWKRFEKNIEIGRAGSAQIENGLLNSSPAEKQKSPRPNIGNSLPSLENVPSVFFEPDFNLELPSTFAAVIEDQKDVEFDPSNNSDSSKLLERFSHYADTIELHLIHEISLRSSSFFAALTNLRDLQAESEHCLSRISELRTSLQEIDDNGAKRGLQIIHLDSRVRYIGVVGEGCKVINGVKEALHVANELVTASHWDEALDVMEGIQKLWDSPADIIPESFSASSSSELKSIPSNPEFLEPKSQKRRLSFGYNFPISSLHSFTALPEHLRALILDIASSISSELVYILERDLTSYITLSEGTIETKINTDIIERIQFLFQNLKRTRILSNFIGNWRSAAMSAIEDSVRRYLTLSSNLDGSDGQFLADDDSRNRLSAMSHVDFMSIFRSSLTVLRNGIGRLQIQNVAIVELLESMQPLDSFIDLTSFQADLSDILFSIVELAHTRLSRIIDIRSERHIGLSLSQFLDVYTETWDFVIQTETICRRMVVGLRGTIVSQAKAFLQAFHSRRIALLAKVVEDEQWSAVDVGFESQAGVNVLVDLAMRDPPQLILINNVSENTTEPNVDTITNGAKTAKHLIIEDRSYFTVSATLQILSLLTEYLKFVINLSVLTTDVVGRVIEFMKAFNSRTCQVVLGAGAMRSAGLKNITAKHLALASQSLGIIIALIPYVRETFRRHLNPKQAVMLTDFDKLKRDFLEHQNEIHAKLIAIMSDRLSAHCKSLQVVDWKVSRAEVNEYMQLLVKETVTLHKVLSRYLPEQIIEYVMSQVLAAINHRLSEEFEKIELQTQESKDRLIRDAQYLHQKLSVLKGLNAPTNMLETITSDKRIAMPPKPVAQTATAPLTANERLKGIFDRPRKVQNSGKDVLRKSSSPAVLAGPEKVAEKSLSLLPSPPAYEKEKDLPVHEHQILSSQTTEQTEAFRDVDIGTKDIDVSTQNEGSQRVDNVLTISPPETNLALPSTELKADRDVNVS